jgi:hypothetical protein
MSLYWLWRWENKALIRHHIGDILFAKTGGLAGDLKRGGLGSRTCVQGFGCSIKA